MPVPPPRPASVPSPREPHRIRLRGPWQWAPADRPDDRPDEGAAAATVSLPYEASEPGVLRRSFNTPTGLDDGTRVRLRLEGIGTRLAAELNGAPVTDDADVTDRLARPNQLTVRLDAGAGLSAATLELHLPTGPTAAA